MARCNFINRWARWIGKSGGLDFVEFCLYEVVFFGVFLIVFNKVACRMGFYYI